jgi:aryl-alcohol dehydrogenase-like predicted oxidoreductase
VTEHPTLVSAARAAGATAAQVALAWLLAHGPHVLLIPGTSSPSHLAQNVAAGGLHLPAETVAALNRLAPGRGIK